MFAAVRSASLFRVSNLTIMDEAGRELPPDAVGMLCARGENVMLGYIQDPAATAEVLNSDGWLRTGDQGYQDKDGYFYLQGRANLLVKVQGHRVHPAEIEMVVEAGFPQVRAVALPVAQGDETRFALFLVPHGDQPIDAAAIRAACLRELPPHKVPVHFEVLDQLPLTPAYKVDRVALGTRVLAHSTRGELGEIWLRLIASKLKPALCSFCKRACIANM